MWLLTAVGPVHGQSKFTFALEQKKEYIVGRDQSCGIRFESKHVRPKEGTLLVDDWDPTHPRTPASLRWRTEPKKNGTYGPYKTLTLRDPDEAGSIEKEDYEITEMKDGAGGHGCFLEKGSEGILLADDNWFIAEWKDLCLQYDKMKDESDDVRDILRRYCISWTQTLDVEDRPNYVLSTSLRSNVDLNYAVCFGIRILLPVFLEALIVRLKACWKAVADSQDSFSLPNEEDRVYQPPLDPTIQAARKELRTWLPDPRRETLFAGWKILGLRGKTQPAEKRYLIAMGAEYQDIDVLTQPLTSKDDFLSRIDSWVKYIDSDGDREQAMVVWFMPVKAELTKKGLDFVKSVSGPCQQLGIIFVHGGVLWGSVSYEGPREYCSAILANIDHNDKAAGSKKASVPANSFAIPEIPQQIQKSQAQPQPSQSGQSHRPDFVPSSFPEETTRTVTGRSPSPSIPSRPLRRARQNTSPLKEKSPELFPETSTSVAKKPLRRRANRGPVEPSQFPDSLPVINDVTPDNSQGSQTHPSFVQNSQSEEDTQQPMFPSQRMDIDSIAPSQPTPTQGTMRKLKRRAGGATPSLIQEIADTSIDIERDIKAEETAAEIRELYEQTGTSSFDPRALKRSRLGQGSAIAELAESSLSDKSFPRLRRSQNTSAMDVDYRAGPSLPSSIFGTRSRKNGLEMPPAGQRVPEDRSLSEEQEEVEPERSASSNKARSVAKKAEHVSPVKTKTTSSQPSKDEEFLQAITKASKAKKAIDELDKEFNQLRIPKPNGKTAVVKANEWEAARPDWNILNDFDDDVTGNFIQIIRKDLFRKDGGREEAQRVDDGKPNFKKFKKKNIVRREPLGMVLAAPAPPDAEMGEPYWPTQAVSKASNKRTQSQSAQAEEDDMPLLPRARKRLLGTQATPMTQDDEPPSSTMTAGRSTQRRSRVPETQTTTTIPSAAGSQPQRKTRGTSVVSKADSIGTITSVATSTRAKRSGTGTGTTASNRATRNKVKEPIVLEDSEEDDDGVNWAGGGGGASTNSASAKIRSAGVGTGTGTGTITLDDDQPFGTGRGRRSQAVKSIATATPGASAGIGGRRKLLPADDDDGMGFRGLGKKRRLG